MGNKELLLEVNLKLDGFNASLGNMGKGFNETVKEMTKNFKLMANQMTEMAAESAAAIEKLASVMDNTAKASKTTTDVSKAQSRARLGDINSTQNDAMKRANKSYSGTFGLENFTDATAIMKNFAALNAMLGTATKGAGILKSPGGAAAMMRGITKIEQHLLEMSFGEKTVKKVLDAAGDKAGGSQKVSTQALVRQLADYETNFTKQFEKPLSEKTKKLIDQALTGYDKATGKWAKQNQFATNLKTMGKESFDIFNSASDPNGGAKKIQEIFAEKYKQVRRQIQYGLEQAIQNGNIPEFEKATGIKVGASPDITALDENDAKNVIRDFQKRFAKTISATARKMVKAWEPQNFRNIAETSIKGDLVGESQSQSVLQPLNDTDLAKIAADMPKGVAGFFQRVKDKFHKASISAEHSIQSSGDKMTQAFDSLGYRLITVSYMLQKFNFAVSNVLNGLTTAATTRQTDIGRTQPILAGSRSASGSELSSYRAELEKIAGETGRSFESLSRSLYDTASAFPNVSDKMAVTRVAANMAAVGFGNAERNIEGLIAVSKTYNRELETSPLAFEAAINKLGDLSIAAANVGTLELDELANAMQTMAPSASNLGVTIDELYASIASTAGVIGNTSEAAAKVKQLFVAFMSPNKKMNEFYSEQGVSGGREFIQKSGGFMQAMSLLEEKVGASGNWKQYTGRSQAQEAAIGLTGSKGDYQKALNSSKYGFLELEDATAKATSGIAYWSTEYAAATERYKTIQAGLGESLLPLQVAFKNLTNDALGLFNGSFGEFAANTLFMMSKFAMVAGALAAFIGGLSLASRGMASMSLEMATKKAMTSGVMAAERLGYTGQLTTKMVGNQVMAGIQQKDGFMQLGTSATVKSFSSALSTIGWGVALVAVVSTIVGLITSWKKAQFEKSKTSTQSDIEKYASPVVDAEKKVLGDAIEALAKINPSNASEISKSLGVIENLGQTYSQKAGEVSVVMGKLALIMQDAVPIGLGKGGKAYTEFIDFRKNTALSPEITKIMEGLKLTNQSSRDGAIVELMNLFKQWTGLAASATGVQGPTKPKSYAEESADGLKQGAREIFSNVLLDYEGKIGPYNQEEEIQKFINKNAEEARKDAMLDPKATAATGAQAYRDGAAAAAEAIRIQMESAGWTPEQVKALTAQGVKLDSKPSLSAMAVLTGQLRGLSEQAATAARYTALFGNALISTSYESEKLALLEKSVADAAKESLFYDAIGAEGPMVLAQLLADLPIQRMKVFSESLENAEKAISQAIQGSAFDASAPQWKKNAARNSLIGSFNSAQDPAVMVEALRELLKNPANKSGIVSGELSDLIRQLEGTSESVELMAKFTNPDDIATIANAFRGKEGMVGSGSDQMSVFMAYLSSAKDVSRSLIDSIQLSDIKTIADADFLDKMLKSFDVLGIAARKTARSMEESRLAFEGPGAINAAALRQRADDLRSANKLGSDSSDVAAFLSPEIRKMNEAEAVRLELQARVQEILPEGAGNPIKAWVDQGGVLEITDKMKKGLKGFFENIKIKNIELNSSANPASMLSNFAKPGELSGTASTGAAGAFNNVISGISTVVGALTAGLGALMTAVIAAAAVFAPVVLALMVLKIVIDSMMKVIGPVLEEVIAPLVGIFGILGQLLGTLLVPIIRMLLPVVMFVVDLFVYFYNILQPVFEGISDILGVFLAVITYSGWAIRAAMSYITFWDKSDDDIRDQKPETVAAAFERLFNTTTIQRITDTQTVAFGNSILADDSSTSANGSSADTSKAPDQYFNFYIGSDAITDVNGGKIVSVEYILDQFQARLAQTATMQA